MEQDWGGDRNIAVPQLYGQDAWQPRPHSEESEVPSQDQALLLTPATRALHIARIGTGNPQWLLEKHNNNLGGSTASTSTGPLLISGCDATYYNSYNCYTYNFYHASTGLYS